MVYLMIMFTAQTDAAGYSPLENRLREERRLAKEAKRGRDRGNGRYAHTTFETMCVCGHKLAVHSAATVNGERPCFNCDVPGGDGLDCSCTKFKKARKVA